MMKKNRVNLAAQDDQGEKSHRDSREAASDDPGPTDGNPEETG